MKLIKNQSNLYRYLCSDSKRNIQKALKKARESESTPSIGVVFPTNEYSPASVDNTKIAIPLAYLLGVRISYRNVYFDDRVRMGFSVFGHYTNVIIFEDILTKLLGVIYGDRTVEAAISEYEQLNIPPFKKRKHYGTPKGYASEISKLLYDFILLHVVKTLEVYGNNPKLMDPDGVGRLRPLIQIKRVKDRLLFKVNSKNIRKKEYILNP